VNDYLLSISVLIACFAKQKIILISVFFYNCYSLMSLSILPYTLFLPYLLYSDLDAHSIILATILSLKFTEFALLL
jgi:hypothetical protein